MNTIFALECIELNRVIGYVKITHIINHSNSVITERGVILQLDNSWDEFQTNGGGKVSTFVAHHNDKYASKIEVFNVVSLRA